MWYHIITVLLYCWTCFCSPVLATLLGSEDGCEAVPVGSMLTVVLTDGKAPGCYPWKGVIREAREPAASALTPWLWRLPGPRSRGQCLPFTPRYSCSLPWPSPACRHSAHTPGDSRPIRTSALSESVHPLPKHTHCHCHTLHLRMGLLSPESIIDLLYQAKLVYFTFGSFWMVSNVTLQSARQLQGLKTKVLHFMLVIERLLPEC